MILPIGFAASLLAQVTNAKNILYDGRTPFNYTSADLDASAKPYITGVKGANASASTFTKLLGRTLSPTPLWAPVQEQPVSISITPQSIFIPGGNIANTQYGFRRTELIASSNNRTALEVGTTVFHFSIRADPKHPLNLTHEYQIVFIEPNDGSHVFGVQLGTPFTVPSATKPGEKATYLKVLDHSLNVLYSVPFLSNSWYNFAVQVDWDARTLAVLSSRDASPLRKVTGALSNNSTASGSAGQGDFHWGVLKLPLADPKDTTANQGDVVHHGIQENTTEALIYSGVFVEDVKGGISVGYGKTIPRIV